MTDILTNSASIPYGTWGGGRSLAQSKSISISANNVPYTYGPLVNDLFIGSDLTDVEPDTRPVITNMYEYARLNIPSYNTITSIPSGHLPTDINTSLAKDWYYAFNYCRNLTSLPDPFYDTSNATNMSRMFITCINLTIVPNFNTSNATNMSGMFSFCSNLTTIPNFDTSNVTNMRSMFNNCPNLTTVPNFDTSNVTNMSFMFYNCSNLTTIPNFDTSNVTDMIWMFRFCYNIKGDLYIESNNVIDAEYMFFGCTNYAKNIYCHANTNTYNTIYRAMGSNTYNSNWNAHLYTMEDNYAYINTYNNTFMGSGYILRFPTNKVEVCTNTGTLDCVLEVIPYTNYFIEDYIVTPVTPDGDMIPRCMYQFSYTNSNGIDIRTERNVILPVCPSFRFFNGIENSTANYSLL